MYGVNIYSIDSSDAIKEVVVSIIAFVFLLSIFVALTDSLGGAYASNIYATFPLDGIECFREICE